MSNYYNAVEMSPVLAPGPEATAPERFEGIYRMPSFVTIPTSDLTASVDFWTQGLDFFELFSVPGQLVHLRRWAFQDVLLVPTPVTLEQEAPAMSVGAKTVNGPSPLRVSARPAAWTAATSVV